MKKLLISLTLVSLIFGSTVLAETNLAETTPEALPQPKIEKPVPMLYSAKPKASSTINVICIQTAVEKRETALLSAFDVYASSTKAAISARSAALKTAWTLSDRKQRRQALTTAWNNFRKAQSKANAALKKARLQAGKQYEADRKACGKSLAAEDVANITQQPTELVQF
ncbi:MAG: hypothetical protein WCK11_02435 [Candidatus Falkowbacteria bacterium]